MPKFSLLPISTLTIFSLLATTACNPDEPQDPTPSDTSSAPDSPDPETPPKGDHPPKDPEDPQSPDGSKDPQDSPKLPEPDPELPDANHRLYRPARSCEDFQNTVAKASKAAMRKRLEAKREDFLRRKALDPSQCQPPDGGDEVPDGGSEDSPEEAKDASTTNNQVAGVDEADFVKNDRSHIYVLAENFFQVVDAWPADKAHRISKTYISGTPTKMFVHEDRAFIYSSGENIGKSDPVFDQARWGRECTYGYDCDFVGDGKDTLVTEFDLSDLSSPKLIRRSRISASLLGARRIGDRIYSVVVYPNLESQIDGLTPVPSSLTRHDSPYTCGKDIPLSKSEIQAAFDELQQNNDATIDKADLSTILPAVKDEMLDPATGQMVDTSTAAPDCGSLMISKNSDSTNVLSILGTNMHTPTPYTETSIFARPGAVYANGAHLYVASRHYADQMGKDWFYPGDPSLKDATALHRFDLFHKEDKIRYVGGGSVKGRILNQFSLSHHEGHLRVTTTTGRLPSLETHNTLSILAPKNGELKVTGEIDNIAPTEDIRSVRFVGDKGYIVTFKKTDPLFVFDLSDPTAPSIEGELKIPGFSTYMHPMGDNHLLTIGFDAQDEGKFAYFTGIQLQIMDVSNPNNPQLVHKEVIGTRGSTSAAATNHLAFNYYAHRKLLALPMIVCESEPGASIFDATMTFNGLLVYNATPADGFTRLGGLPLELGAAAKSKDACYTWWTRAMSPVKRSVFMEDFVYAVASDEIRVSSTKSPSSVLSTVSLKR